MIEVREYQPQDGPGYVEVHNTVWSGDNAIDIETWERWSRQPITASIALEDGKVVGAVPFHFRDFVLRPGLVIRAAFEYSVCVLERLRSQGIGSKLMEHVENYAKEKSIECIKLNVLNNNDTAIGFYAKNDFKVKKLGMWKILQT